MYWIWGVELQVWQKREPTKVHISHVESTCITAFISLRGEIWVHKSSWTPPLFMIVPVSSHESERSCIYMLGHRFCLFRLFFHWILEMFRHGSISVYHFNARIAFKWKLKVQHFDIIDCYSLFYNHYIVSSSTMSIHVHVACALKRQSQFPFRVQMSVSIHRYARVTQW